MSSTIRNPRKLYVSNVPRDARERDIGRLFEGCGRIVRLQFKQNFCFVEYATAESAGNAIRRFSGFEFMGRRLVVEQYSYRGGDPRYRPKVLQERSRDVQFSRPPNSKSGYRLLVYGLDSMTSWQDLKDFGRSAGKTAIFADVYTRRGKKEGVVEYRDYEDFCHALKFLNDARLNGVKVSVYGDTQWNNKLRGSARSRSRSISNSRNHRDRTRSRNRTRTRSRDRYRDIDRGRDRDRDRNREKARENRREQGRDRQYPRQRSYSPNHDYGYTRENREPCNTTRERDRDGDQNSGNDHRRTTRDRSDSRGRYSSHEEDNASDNDNDNDNDNDRDRDDCDKSD